MQISGGVFSIRHFDFGRFKFKAKGFAMYWKSSHTEQ